MKKYVVLLAGTVLAIFYACKPEINVNDHSKDVSFCYLILNPKDSAHYAKIYKGFLYENGLAEAASEEDNLYYFDSIEVSLKEYVDNHLRRTLPMVMTDEVPKEDGLFANPTQIVYKLLDSLNTEAEYEIVIKNKYSGAVKTAKTKMVENLSINDMGAVVMHRATSLLIRPSKNLAALEVYATFHYIEVNKNTQQIVNRKHIRLRLNNSLLKPIAAWNGTMKYDIDLSAVYRRLADELQADPNIVRYKDGATCLEYEIWGCAEDLLTYIESNTASSSIISDKNIYTNFKSDDNSAYGIFSSRNVYRQRLDILPASEDSLVKGSWTRYLGFHKYYEYLGGQNP